MRTALDSIRSEHRNLEAVLHAIRDLVSRIRGGSGGADSEGLRGMVYYIDAFSARLHHPKEEEFLFQPLRARSGDAQAIIDDLEREHARGAEAMRSVEQAMLRYEAGGKGEFVDFATAVEGFCDFYERHMRKEETLAMPLAENLFNEKEWARIDKACVAAQAQQACVDEELEFRQLFRRIVGRDPAAPGADPDALLA